MQTNNKIIYVTYNLNNLAQAHRINSDNRVRILRSLGYSITVVDADNFSKFSLAFFKLIITNDILYIRIDGSAKLDTFTLARLIKPSLKIIWEIHGFPEENYLQISDIKSAVYLKHLLVKRYLLAQLTDRIIAVTHELALYGEKKLNKKIYIIPNYILNSDFKKKIKTKFDLRKRDTFIVMWVGNPNFPWHGIEIIESVAKFIHKIDKNIHFVLIGADPIMRISWKKNISSIKEIPRKEALPLLKQANICLAIYQTTAAPLYFFPLKLLDYMLLKKPIIATNFGSLKEIIIDNKTGLLTSNKVSSISSKILFLKNNPSFAKKIGENAYLSALNLYSEKKVKKMYKTVFKNLLRN